MTELIFDGLLRGSAAVASVAVGGVYPVALPKDQTIWPAIHYLFVGGSNMPTADTYGIQRQRVEVSCWAKSYYDAVTLRNTVTAALLAASTPAFNIALIQNIDFDEHEDLLYRALVEFYVTSTFTS